MEALNQSENNSTEDEEVIDPITITVNAGASLPESASIARKEKIPKNKLKFREDQAKRKRQNHRCEYMGSSQRVPKPTLCRGKRKA